VGNPLGYANKKCGKRWRPEETKVNRSRYTLEANVGRELMLMLSSGSKDDEARELDRLASIAARAPLSPESRTGASPIPCRRSLMWGNPLEEGPWRRRIVMPCLRNWRSARSYLAKVRIRNDFVLFTPMWNAKGRLVYVMEKASALTILCELEKPCMLGVTGGSDVPLRSNILKCLVKGYQIVPRKVSRHRYPVLPF
jgi:hypothetical protein